MRPGILVLDEPTAGLDPVSESQMIELLLRLNRRQKITLILATHSVDLLPVLAQRIYLLRRGRVEREGPPREILCDAAAAAADKAARELAERDALLRARAKAESPAIAPAKARSEAAAAER